MASLVAAGYGSSTDDELDSESEGRQETTKTKSDSSDSSTSSNSDSDDVDENEQSEWYVDRRAMTNDFRFCFVIAVLCLF